MGENKLLLPYKGKTIIETVIEHALDAFPDITVVTGHDKERLEDALSKYDIDLVYNPMYLEGQRSSTLRGIESIGDDDFAILPGDLPLIRKEDLEGTEQLLENHEIARAVHSGIPGHPVMYRKELRKHLLAFKGSMKEYLALYNVGSYNASLGTVYDIDTQERYQALLRGNADISLLR